MALTLSLPPLETRPANPPEIRPQKVASWLDEMSRRDAAEAARAIGDALAATNRVVMSDARRLELADKYWSTASALWPLLERSFTTASHPLAGAALEAAKAALSLSHELSVAYKHLLVRESERRLVLGTPKALPSLIHRCLQSALRTFVNSYLSYAPVPAKTWLDAHAVYAFARKRNLHLHVLPGHEQQVTPERLYIQVLLLALANPYGFMPGQLSSVLRYVQTHADFAKLIDTAPVHRMAKAVAIIPLGHDFPPFSANKGGTVDGNKLFLLTYDLAFELQEQLKKLDAGGDPPTGIGRDRVSRRDYTALLKRLLRQWAVPPARQFSRLPSRAKVVMCAGLTCVWQYSRGAHNSAVHAGELPPMTICQVLNHTPAGYALRQIDAHPTALRIGDLIALKVEGRSTLQAAVVRWFRNTLKASGLEFGCELLSDAPEAASAVPEGGDIAALTPVLVLPEDSKEVPGLEPAPSQVAVPAGKFDIEQAITLKRGAETGFAVLTKLVEQGPGFELYEFVRVG